MYHVIVIIVHSNSILNSHPCYVLFFIACEYVYIHLVSITYYYLMTLVISNCIFLNIKHPFSLTVVEVHFCIQFGHLPPSLCHNSARLLVCVNQVLSPTYSLDDTINNSIGTFLGIDLTVDTFIPQFNLTSITNDI